ncbi:MAG: bifunctional DNA-binding transcriptional regulator/O6-methylguanine-DNA methyltransferase Ada [Rhodospirillales bacterium]
MATMKNDHATAAATVDDPRWARVLGRDAGSDGTFVYAVTSTGVYCRPSCPSRKPAPERVRFFPLPEAAEVAGFRPCRRCRPERTPAPDPGLEAVRHACREIAASEDGIPTLSELGRETGLSPHHLQRLFKGLLGVSPRKYGEALRLQRLKKGLRGGERIADALYGAGYGSSSRLYEKAGPHLGMTPASYAKGGQGARIAYATAESPLGRLLVAATAKGVCMVALGSGEKALIRELEAEYPAAEIRRNEGALTGRLTAVLNRIGGGPGGDLPLDVRATAFQWRVWEALAAIPAGETRSYGEIAHTLGKPGAARAVGRACAANPVAVVIPCHRAMGASGALTGYRWGTGRKKALLAAEKEKTRKAGDG